MPLDAHFKELSYDIVLVTYNQYFVDQNYKSKFDTKNEVALYKGMEGVCDLHNEKAFAQYGIASPILNASSETEHILQFL